MKTSYARKGSILMEGVIVLPLWVMIFGGVFGLGQKGMDFIRVKGSERFAAESAIERTGARGPELSLAATEAFRDRGRAWTETKTLQVDSRSYVLMACGETKLTAETMVNFFGGMLAPPLYGISMSDEKMSEELSSSRKGMRTTRYTHFLLARTPRSTLSRRNWDASLIVDKDIWEFKDDEDDNNDYPDTWDEHLGSPPPARDPRWGDYKVEDPYERGEIYEEWSGKAIQDEGDGMK